MSVRKKLNKARKARRENWERARIEAGSTEKLCYSQRSNSARLAKQVVKQRTENRNEQKSPDKLERRRSEHEVLKPVLYSGKLWVLRGIGRRHTDQVKQRYPEARWSSDLGAFVWRKK